MTDLVTRQQNRVREGVRKDGVCGGYSDAEAATAFFSRTVPEPNSGCLLWTGNIHERGYGIIRRKYRPVFAHRFAYALAHGPIPRGLYVCHHCDTRLCVNVDHLFLGTPADNIHDAQRKGRLKHPPRTVCKKGHTLAGDNVRIVRDKGDDRRRCRQCWRAKMDRDNAARRGRPRIRRAAAKQAA